MGKPTDRKGPEADIRAGGWIPACAGMGGGQRVAKAGRVFKDVRATVVARQMQRAVAVDGIIGVELTRYIGVVFDFSRDRVWLTPAG